MNNQEKPIEIFTQKSIKMKENQEMLTIDSNFLNEKDSESKMKRENQIIQTLMLPFTYPVPEDQFYRVSRDMSSLDFLTKLLRRRPIVGWGSENIVEFEVEYQSCKRHVVFHS